MKERPILFSGAMIRAILEGRKTQTRRVVKPQDLSGSGWGVPTIADSGTITKCIARFCPYGVPGDRLWVRETWGVGSRPDPWGGYDGIEYRADEGFIDPNEKYPTLECVPVKTPDDVCLGDYRSGWHPSIHMPRWASRITLEITDVRVQRLQEISCADAIAEGIHPAADSMTIDCDTESPRDGFHSLWDSINAKKHPWGSNPWIWALTFRRLP